MMKHSNKSQNRATRSGSSQKRFDNATLFRTPRSIEAKFFPINLNQTWTVGSGGSFGTTPVYYEWTGGIISGTGVAQRIGRRIHVHDIRLCGTLHGGQSNNALDDNHNSVRVVVVSGTPSVMGTSISASLSLSTQFTRTSIGALDEVFYDKTVDLASPGRDSTGYMPALKRFDITIPVNRPFQYTSEGTAIASFRALYIACVSDSSAAPSPGWDSGYMTIRFSDA